MLQEDDNLAAIYKQCRKGTMQGTKYIVKQEFHASKIGGHEGVTKSVSRICKQFYWPKMQQDIRDFVRECTICQRTKVEQALPAGLLHPLLIP